MSSYSGKLLFTFAILIVLLVAHVSIASGRYGGPIIDAHSHLGASFNWDTMIDVMDRNNISRQIVMARYYPGPAGSADRPGSDELAVELARKYPGRFFPLVGMQRPELTGADKWHNPDEAIEAILSQTEAKLATGRFWGIGEVIVKHFAYTSGRHAELENPVYSTFMKRLSKLAADFNVPIVLHMEGKPGLVQDFSRLLRENSQVHYIWAHNCGRSKASVIRKMLENHRNLYCDLAGMTNVGKSGYGTGWPRMEVYTALIEQEGVLFPEMSELFESFPDRFMIGTDVAHAQGMNHRNYARRVNRFRQLLNQLSPKTALAIAEGNAIRIFRLDR
jgi:Tat protein secretion system quality control protein TatD with DNase activity